MSHPMTIGGESVDATETIDVVDPATGRVFATAPDASREQVDAAIAAATAAGPAWAADEAGRVSALEAAAAALEAAVEPLAELLTREQGKPLAAARYEVTESSRWLRAAAALDLPVEQVEAPGQFRTTIRRRPLGVVAAITPWNFPLLLLAWKLGPALRAGNTIVAKPSPYTPLSTLLMGRVLQDALPPGVVNVVTGSDRIGGWLTAHPDVRKISFTGSIATGQKVMAAAAADLKRLTLELGGNDAAIVLDDADPATIARGIFLGGFANCGQVCAGIKRVFVPEHLHDALVDALVDRATALRIGPGSDPSSQMGPIQNRMQFDRVTGLVQDAIAAGATAAAGGSRIGDEGYFLQATVLTGAREGMRVVDEEQFGPVMPVLSYRDLDEAIARANGTMFGLTGSVWSADPERAARVAERLDCGIAFVNDHLTMSPEVPFGGSKWSGIGVENGHWGLDEFVQLQAVQVPDRG